MLQTVKISPILCSDWSTSSTSRWEDRARVFHILQRFGLRSRRQEKGGRVSAWPWKVKVENWTSALFSQSIEKWRRERNIFFSTRELFSTKTIFSKNKKEKNRHLFGPFVRKVNWEHRSPLIHIFFGNQGATTVRRRIVKPTHPSCYKMKVMVWTCRSDPCVSTMKTRDGVKWMVVTFDSSVGSAGLLRWCEKRDTSGLAICPTTSGRTRLWNIFKGIFFSFKMNWIFVLPITILFRHNLYLFSCS